MATTPLAHQPDARRTSPPESLRKLIDRFDPAVMHIPGGSARIRLAVRDAEDWDALLSGGGIWLSASAPRLEPDALLTADEETWDRIARDVRGGMDAFRRRRLEVRRNLHLGVGFLAATSGMTEPGRLRFESVRTRGCNMSILEAGTGPPVLCLHGLGGTKASFLPTVEALADTYRVIAVDLPGFGESDKPISVPYDAEYFARELTWLLDALEIEKAELIGNSMGGRVAIEMGLRHPERVGHLALLSPALAWLRERGWQWLLRMPVSRLGLVQPTPRWAVEPIVRRLIPGGDDGWVAAGVDEFLRSYLTPRGRMAFYEAARNVYLDEPLGEDGFWTRLKQLSPETLFVWGRRDSVVPIGFMKHVERALPAARHVELDCGHVPQLERPRETHAAIRDFFS